MGIVLLDQHDVFISYARDDNVLCDEAVHHFRAILKARFEAEMRRRRDIPAGRQADIFMDRYGLPANGSLSEELELAIERTTFLFIFVGQSYPRSRWCSLELQAFIRKFQGERPAALLRTFIVVLERSALHQSWGEALEQPERPIYEEFFDEGTGGTIPFFLEGPDGQACQSPRLTRRLRRIVETMADRAIELHAVT